MAKRIDDPKLKVDADSVLVLRNGGPLGGPGMPEWGMLPIPKKLLKQGVRDMVRISDARMSGTSYGTCVLHVAPESFVGGPLALVRNGDRITLDVAARKLTLEVDAAELARRRKAWKAPAANSSAAMARCSPSISARPTKAATSTSSKAPRRHRIRRSTEAARRGISDTRIRTHLVPGWSTRYGWGVIPFEEERHAPFPYRARGCRSRRVDPRLQPPAWGQADRGGHRQIRHVAHRPAEFLDQPDAGPRRPAAPSRLRGRGRVGFSSDRDVNAIEWELFSPTAQDEKIVEIYGALAGG